jgi:hypothetical protein
MTFKSQLWKSILGKVNKGTVRYGNALRNRGGGILYISRPIAGPYHTLETSYGQYKYVSQAGINLASSSFNTANI